jgi:hypothetical protein
MNTQELKKELYATLTQLAEGDLTTASVISKVPLMMHAIEKVNGVLKMKGAQKKDLLIKVLTDYIQKEKDDEDDVALYFVQEVLPPLIDTLVQVDKKEITIKIKKCCAKCLPF